MRRAGATLEPGSGLRLAAFAGLSAVAAWRYAGVETRAPTGRVIAIGAAAVAAAIALMLLRTAETAPRRTRALAAVARVMVLLALFGVALLAAGVPAGLLRPARWGTLGHDLGTGLDTIATTLWPYAGTNAWTRLDLLLALAAVPIVAAAIGFWPARSIGSAAALRYAFRQVGALALLLALYVIGVIDSSGRSVTTDGLLLLVLVASWLWLPGLRTRRAWAAFAWLAGAGAVAAVVTGQLGGGQAWVNYRAWNLLGVGHQGVSFAWDQSYGPIAWSRSERTMFTVAAPKAQLWKTITLDRFDGLRFVRSGADAASFEDLPLPLDDRWYTFATFTIRGLSSRVLPSEQGTTVGVNYAGGVRHDGDGTARTPGPAPGSGASYTMVSYVPDPTPAELRAAPRDFPIPYLRYTDFDLPAPRASGLQLAATDPARPGGFFTARTIGSPRPGSTPARAPGVERRILASPYGPMYLLAQRLASRARTPYDVALSIENYLKTSYTYSEQPPRRKYPLESFLFTDYAGYCQQFSGAMALMLRMDGIPARVAAGFLPGVYDRTTHFWRVRAVDAHAWVEVFFAGIGWVPFNPTPPRSEGALPQFPKYESSRTVFPYAALAAAVGHFPQPVANRIPVGRRARTRRSSDASLIVLIAAALAGLVALLAAAARWVAGSVRLSRSLGGDAELASRELVRALRRLGYAMPATVTLATVESVVRVHGGANAARYVQLLRERRYGAGASANATLRDRRRLRLGITAHLGLDARIRGLWALPPGTLGWRIGAGGENGRS